ncbi:uncharacterized protein LOC110418128 [Herrania umbratica]|uniref:Uncharacterized protein LOC110418128 n=1 Tax=Herrania umbratica TaxID=108875 RepID=A0A6J1AGX4_9ROSI|nr:uncharacterized protein LOC110418128 [Herrania umbratica]
MAARAKILSSTQQGSHLCAKIIDQGLQGSDHFYQKSMSNGRIALLFSSNILAAMQDSTLSKPLQSSIDQGYYLNVKGDGMVTAEGNEPRDTVPEEMPNEHMIHSKKEDTIQIKEQVLTRQTNYTLTSKSCGK